MQPHARFSLLFFASHVLDNACELRFTEVDGGGLAFHNRVYRLVMARATNDEARNGRASSALNCGRRTARRPLLGGNSPRHDAFVCEVALFNG